MKQLFSKQIVKSGVVGILNTVIDLLILNAFIALFGLENGDGGDYKFVAFKSLSFLIAVANSFFLNKLWVFQNRNFDSHAVSKQAASFFAISLLGFLLNVTVSYLVFNFGYQFAVNAGSDISVQTVANIGAIAGTVAVFMFNFLGYKKIVFASHNANAGHRDQYHTRPQAHHYVHSHAHQHNHRHQHI